MCTCSTRSVCRIGVGPDEASGQLDHGVVPGQLVGKRLADRGTVAVDRRLVAAGFGPYSPISSNGSARGRQNNRRIEIILEPYLRPPPAAAKKKKKKSTKKKSTKKKRKSK